jgi:hypothetical protein
MLHDILLSMIASPSPLGEMPESLPSPIFLAGFVRHRSSAHGRADRDAGPLDAGLETRCTIGFLSMASRLMQRCDVAFRIEHESRGADKHVRPAPERELPVNWRLCELNFEQIKLTAL